MHDTGILTTIDLPEFPIEYKGLVFPKTTGIPAGTVVTDPKTLLKLARTGIFGFLSTKSTGPKKPGNREPIMGQPYPGSLQNSVGLSNPGSEEYSLDMGSVFEEIALMSDPPVIMASIFGNYDSTAGWVNSGKLMVESAKSRGFTNVAIVLNFSCPHSEGFGADSSKKNGDSCGPGGLDIREKIVKDVKAATGVVIFEKVGPWDEEILKDHIPKMEKAGVDGFVTCNSGPGLYLDPYDGQALVTNRKGGISGDLLKPYSLLTCKTISELTDLPLIVMGGIGSIHEILQYRAAIKDNDILGYAIGTKNMGLSTKKLLHFHSCLDYDYRNKTDTASKLLDTRKLMHYEPFKITQIEDNGGKTKTFSLEALNRGLKLDNVNPGTWFFLGTVRDTEDRGPTFEEKPFSVASAYPLKFVISDRGPLTHEFMKLEKGNIVKVKGILGKHDSFGPYGKELIENCSYLIAGGTGLGPILRESNWANEIVPTIFYGASNEKELFQIDDLEENSKELIIATDDGSYKDGYKGTVVDAVESYLDKMDKTQKVFTCGPEPMMVSAINVLSKAGFDLDNIYCSIERQCECGIGICGKCSFDGDRICVDGNIYSAMQLLEEHESFGKYHKGKDGSKNYFPEETQKIVTEMRKRNGIKMEPAYLKVVK